MSSRKVNFDSRNPCASELSTTIDQWRAALEVTKKPEYPEGKTMTELSAETGINISTLRDRIRNAINEGVCECFYDSRKNRMTKVYILKK
jgi:hypothetical protein